MSLNYLLLESGSGVLLESGSGVLLESSTTPTPTPTATVPLGNVLATILRRRRNTPTPTPTPTPSPGVPVPPIIATILRRRRNAVTPITVVYAGDDVLEAIQNWWDANGTGYTPDRTLHHLEAPEITPLPYCTIFLVSEDCETNTTSFQTWRSNVQVNCHAATSFAARSLAITLRDALRKAPLVVGGIPVWYVLCDSQVPPQVGEGRGPNGSDCWIAGVTFDIPWNT